MAKQTGMGMNYYVGGYDLSGLTNSLGSIHGGPNTQQDVTDITQSGVARLGLLRDGGINWVSYFDPTGNAHTLLSTLPTADELCTVFVPPLALGSPAFSLNSKVVGYDPQRATDGSLVLNVNAFANGFGGEWGIQLTPGHRVDGAAVAASSSNSFDTGASLSLGVQMYVQLFAFSGTSVTISLWDSADNITFAAVSGVTTTALTTANQTVRIASSNTATVRRYIAIATVGTFSNADFAVMVNKNVMAGVVF
jgi:hypothetical protein